MNRFWMLEVRAPCEWMTANRVAGKYTKEWRARLTRAWRKAVAEAAAVERLPINLDYIRVDAVARFLGRAPVRDRANLAPTLKAAVDGLTPAHTVRRDGKEYRVPGHGLIPDDSDKYLAASGIEIGPPLSPHMFPSGTRGLLILNITELKR